MSDRDVRNLNLCLGVLAGLLISITIVLWNIRELLSQILEKLS